MPAFQMFTLNAINTATLADEKRYVEKIKSVHIEIYIFELSKMFNIMTINLKHAII